MTKRDIIKLLKEVGACGQALIWVEDQPSARAILRCNRGDWWSWLMRRKPGLEAYCRWEHFESSDWAFLLQTRSRFADRCPWDELTGRSWVLIISRQPHLAARYKCPWDRLPLSQWPDLLRLQPRFAKHCPWDELDMDCGDWRRLLKAQPQLAKWRKEEEIVL